jgi:hypothetical protein
MGTPNPFFNQLKLLFMQTSSFFQFKRIIVVLSVIFVSSFLVFSTCNGKNSKNPVCVQLTKAQLKKWATKGYIDPGNSAIVRIKAAYVWPGTLYKVYAGVQKSDGSLIGESVVELSPIDSCNKSHIKLDDFIFSGTLQVGITDWNIWKTNGGKTINDSLEYIQFDPYNYNYKSLTLLAFHDYVVKKGGIRSATYHKGQQIEMYSILPCPPCPNCKSACPPPSSCTGPAPCTDIAIDTTDF